VTGAPNDRVAVVTGAGQGLGEAIAGRLVRDGFRVVFADLNLEAAEAVARAADASGARASARQLDVRLLESVQGCLDAAVARWGAVDVWVNNAARTVARTFFEIDPAEWDDVIATNLRGTYFGCRVAGTHMCAQGSGRIVNLASVAGQWGRGLTGAHYAASKAGIVSLTRSAAMACAEHGVTVNAVAPAAIDGPAVATMPVETMEAYTRTIPLGRLGRAEEVAALVAYLASDDTGFTTGATYDINGGLLMR
jgi:3-oxoacyl-[acyl-carrier protein] reductase